MRHFSLLLFFFFSFYFIGFPQVGSSYHKYRNGIYTQHISDLAQINNDHFLITAKRQSAALLKTTASGQLIWAKQYYSNSDNISFDRIVPTTGSASFVSGTLFLSNSYGGIVLSKVDSSGSIQWTKQYNLSNTQLRDMIKTSEGNLLLTASDSSKTVVLKVDTLGNVLWSKHFYGTDMPPQYLANLSFSTSVTELPDQSLVFVSSGFGYHSNWSGVHLLVFKTDSVGNLIWSKRYGFPENNYIFGSDHFFQGGSILSSSDNAIWVTYYKGQYGSFGGSDDLLLKLDANGNILFDKKSHNTSSIQLVSEHPQGTINLAEMGWHTVDVAFPRKPRLVSADLSFSNINSMEYQAVGAPENSMKGMLGLYKVRQLEDKRYTFIGQVGNSGMYDTHGMVLMTTDSAGNESCTSSQEPVYYETDTVLHAFNANLLINSGITVNNYSLQDSILEFNQCNCDSMPVADFDFEINGNTVTFTNNSLGATSYYWNFGDGSNDTMINPTHVYQDSVNHNTYLVAYNDCGESSHTVQVSNVITTSTQLNQEEHLELYPNPSRSSLTVKWPTRTFNNEVNLSITNVLGQLIYSTQVRSNRHHLKLDALDSGTYYIQIDDGHRSISKLFVKK